MPLQPKTTTAFLGSTHNAIVPTCGVRLAVDVSKKSDNMSQGYNCLSSRISNMFEYSDQCLFFSN